MVFLFLAYYYNKYIIGQKYPLMYFFQFKIYNRKIQKKGMKL